MTLRTTSKVSCGSVSRHTHAKARQHTGENGLAMFCNLFEDEIVASLLTLSARKALQDLESAQLHKPSRQDACSVRMQRLFRLVDARPCGNVSRIPTTHCVLSRDVIPEKVREQSIKVRLHILRHTRMQHHARVLALHGSAKTPNTRKSRGTCFVVTDRDLAHSGNPNTEGTRRVPCSRSIGRCRVSRIRTNTGPMA